jgi:hypothetical protein
VVDNEGMGRKSSKSLFLSSSGCDRRWLTSDSLLHISRS